MNSTIKCKAAVVHEMGLPRPYSKSKPISIEEIEIEHPGPNEVLVKVKAAGICHSDLSVVTGARPRPLPMVIGHEGSGIIEKIGSQVKDFYIGDHVVFVFVPSCGQCIPCKEGRPALCKPGAIANSNGLLLSGSSRIKVNNKMGYHQVGVSCFSEYTVVSQHSIVKIDKSLDLIEASLFGCAVITGVGAVVNTANIRMGSTVAILGLGGTGLAALIGAKSAGASKIFAIDLLKKKLNIAKKLGANHTQIASDPEIIDNIKNLSDGGVDYSFECVGSEKAMEMAYNITKRGGTTVSSGLSHPDKYFSIQHVNLVAEEKTIKGSYLGSCVPSRDIPAYINLYKNKSLPINNLLSEKITIEQLNEAFDTLAEGDTIRQIITF